MRQVQEEGLSRRQSDWEEVDGDKEEGWSWYRRDKDDVGGRARVTRDEERVLQRGRTEMMLCSTYEGWVVDCWVVVRSL